MKKLAFFLFASALFSPVVSANDGFVDYGGTGNTPVLQNNEDIRMVDEKLDIILGEEVAVDIAYTFLNTTAEDITVTMGFPEKCEVANDEWNMSADCALRDFRVLADGEELAVQHEEGAPASEEEYEYYNWYTHEVSFSPNEEKKVEIHYNMKVSRSGTVLEPVQYWFDYILATGASWKDTIEKIDIQVKLEDGWTIYNLTQVKPAGFILNENDNTIEWHFANMEPTEEDNIKVAGFLEAGKSYLDWLCSQHLEDPTSITGEDIELLNAESSSHLQEDTFHNWACRAHDGDETTAWQEVVAGYGIGEWMEMPLEQNIYDETSSKTFYKIRVFNGFGKSRDWWEKNSRIKQLKITYPQSKGEQTVTLQDTFGYQIVDLPEPVEIRNGGYDYANDLTVRLEIEEVYHGALYDDTILSEIEFLGLIDGDVVFEGEDNGNTEPPDDSVFSDINGHPYEDAIEYIYSEGIVSGYSDGTYKPDAKINRAEFTKIIMEAVREDILSAQPETEGYMRCDPDSGDIDSVLSFSDVPASEWFATYVCSAYYYEIVSGYPNGTFRPTNEINFVEAAKIIVESFGYDLPAAEGEWYEAYLSVLRNEGAIPDSIRSNDQKITRGEMAEIIYQLKN